MDSYATADTVLIPLQRRYFHDKIDAQQKLCDKADGKYDSLLHVNNNEEINLRLTDALYRKVDELQLWVEGNDQILNNNEKIRYLSYIENVLKDFRIAWKKREINPIDFIVLLENFEEIMKAQVAGNSMVPYIQAVSYPIARINAEIFFDNTGYGEAKNIVYQKFCAANPDKILQTIRPYIDEHFADSLVVLACIANPVQLYSYAQSGNSPEGKLIHRNTNRMVMAVAKLSETRRKRLRQRRLF